MEAGDNRLFSEMLSRRDPSQVAGLSRFFKTGPGQYGEGDRFLGIKVPVTREVVRGCWKRLSFGELEECVVSEYHEVRLAALLALVSIYGHAGKDSGLRRRCVDFYLSHLDHVNNWDLVDLSCYELLGAWLLDKDRSLLYGLARDGRTIWERRIGIVSTMKFIRAGELDDTYAIADILLAGQAPMHDLLQKAAGWLLREAGKRDPGRLRDWLAPRCAAMPETVHGKTALQAMTDFAAIDFETANECPSSVCSVGVVVVRGGEIVDKFYSLIHPEPEYFQWFCRRVHGLGPADTEDAPVFPIVWEKVGALVGNLPLVAHNSPFDEGCLKAVFRVYQMDYPDYEFHDTCAASRRSFGRLLPNHRLPTVAAACGFLLENHHNALADAEACAHIAMKLL